MHSFNRSMFSVGELYVYIDIVNNTLTRQCGVESYWLTTSLAWTALYTLRNTIPMNKI